MKTFLPELTKAIYIPEVEIGRTRDILALIRETKAAHLAALTALEVNLERFLSELTLTLDAMVADAEEHKP